MRRVLSFLLALCLIVGLLPAVAIPHAHAATTTATVTLFNVAVTIDTDDATANIPEALYWVNGGVNADPIAATAADEWNYRFSIIDNIPTVTIRNADYQSWQSFLYARYDGSLRLLYEGTNSIRVPYYSSSAAYYFLNYGSATNAVGKGNLYITGAEGAKLDVYGGDNNSALLVVSNKAYLNISGGTFSIDRTLAGGAEPVINAQYSKTIIEDCTLNVKSVDGVGGKKAAVTMGFENYGVTINNANVNIETNAHIGLCVGVFNASFGPVLYPATLTITGNSNVKVSANSNYLNSNAYSGTGIYANNVTLSGSNLEVEGKRQAVYTASGKDPSMVGCKLYTVKDGEPGYTYEKSTYLKVVPGVPLEKTYTMKIGGVEYKLAAYDVPVYTINTTKTGSFRSEDGPISGEYITQSSTGANETNYNAKLVWPAGDEAPTLYLRDIVVDNYNDGLGQWRRKADANDNYASDAGICTDAVVPLNIVIAGSCMLRTFQGIHYQADLSIKGAEGASLMLSTDRTGIIPSNANDNYANAETHISGNKLTLDANLTVSMAGWANEDNSSHIIRAIGADIVINGGNIITEYVGGGTQMCAGIGIVDGGNLYVNGGYIYVESYNTDNMTIGACTVDGNIYIQGGTVEAYSAAQSGLVAANIYVTGGEVLANVNHGTLVVKDETGVISVTGGTIESTSADGCVFGYISKNAEGKITQLAKSGVVTVGDNCEIDVMAGTTMDTALVLDKDVIVDYTYNDKYVKVVLTELCEHVEEILPAKDATCTEIGLTEGKKCALCGEILVEQTVIDMLDHEWVEVEGKDATCTETGLTPGEKCGVCGEVSIEQEVIETTDHEWVAVEGKPATCTETGLTAGEKCGVCGEVSIEQEVIEAWGHTEEIIPGKAATATEPGLTEGKKCSVCGEILVAQEEIPATGTGECVEHTYTDDNDAVCNNCGYVRQMTDEYKFENYRVVFADSDTTHKNARVEFYKLGDQTVADPTDEKALRAIDGGYKTYWGAEINTILATEAGNYVALLKYNVGTATVKVPLVITVDSDPKLIIDKNNKLTVLDTNETHGHLRIFVYYLGDQTVEDIYDEAALQAIDPEAAKSENIIYHKMFIDKTALTKGGNYVVHLCWNIGTGPKITKAQMFNVFAIPTLTLDVNNMLWMSDENAENNNHRLTIYKMADDLDIDNYDIYDEAAVKKDAVETSKTYWGAAEINGLEIYERGNYIIHLNYSVGTSAKRTIAIGSFLNDRPVAGVTDENKLTMSFTDPDITNERVYYYYFGQNSTEGLDLYDKTALQNAAVSYTTNAIWTKNTIGKTELKELGNYVIHFEYNVKTYDENGVATGSAKKVVVVETTIYDITKPTLTVSEDNKLVFASENTDATNYRATIYNLGDQTVEDIYDEAALKAIDSAAATKWGAGEINKVQLTEGNNYVVLVKYNLGTSTRTVAFQFTV